ncbi:hypothetical protein LXA43DRAFT_104153 [Ganoderma leucocontextum]|nr:hypothetical protein LXA43DRAFT_104153 [Ganoderma leucocontextum]
MPAEPWAVYAKELFPVGFGYPLWKPEPASTDGREIFIGDVGWLKEGEFRALFNSIRDADHPVNQDLDVPRDFQVFYPPNLSIGKADRITQQMVFSQSIRASEVRADIVSDAASGVVPAWQFHTGSDAGALVVLSSPGVAEDIQSRRHIVNYMVDNLDSWLESANTSHLDLHTENIIFVCGTLETTQWAMAAFQDDSYCNTDGYVFGQLDPFGSLELSIQISNQVLPANHCRTVPHRLPDPGHDTPAAVSPGPDQCLFVHNYKGKRRLRKEPGQAPPGLYHLSFDSEARVCAYAYDPVNHLLDYILQV